MGRATLWWLRIIVALALPVIGFGIYLRFASLPDVLCRAPDELAELTPGLRLHGLPFLNLGDPVRYNFFQSLFYSHHGLGDVSFYYLASGALALLGLPTSERWLFAAGGVTNLALALAGGLLGARLLANASTGWVFALLVLLSPFYVFISLSGWARLTWTPLLVILLFLCQQKAMRDRGVWWPTAFCLLAGFVSLTDGFVVFPIACLLGVVLKDGGRLMTRVKRLLRDRVFVAGVLVFALGVAFELMLGLGARRRGTNLTMMAYVMLRGGHGAWLPTRGVLAAWAYGVDSYFPFRGAWLLVSAAFVLAAREAFRGRPIGFVAAWWFLASAGVIRYAAGQEAPDVSPDPSWLNAYNLAVPSLFLVAWLVASIADGSLPGMRRVASSVRAALAFALLLPLMVVMGLQAHTVAFSTSEKYGITAAQLSAGTAGPAGAAVRLLRPAIAAPALSACRALKAAAFYVRSQETRLPYVFQLSSNVFLAHIGELYYGLSYSRSSHPEDPNHLLDFGFNQFGRRHPPDAFYRAYGVSQFDYYVDLVDDRDPFKPPVVTQLLVNGARVVATIHDDEGRVVGRILSCHDEPPIDLDARTAARSWDQQFAKPRTLFSQPLAGTAYHFGYNWRSPE